ncbi:MAG: hypothetical protein JO026_02390, partial [Patescibacteria group bacterium]|nr:hypothetical protein [Patescibacteria group bacterium]
MYLSTFEYPSMHAHPLHALFMARAFTALLGTQFLFVVGKEDTNILSGVPVTAPFGRLHSVIKFLHLRSLFYVLWFAMYSAFRSANIILFTNDLSLAAYASLVKPFFSFRVLLEVHGKASGWVTARAVQGADRVIFVTQELQNEFKKEAYVMKDSLVLGNAVDAALFSNASGTNLRERLTLNGMFVIA